MYSLQPSGNCLVFKTVENKNSELLKTRNHENVRNKNRNSALRAYLRLAGSIDHPVDPAVIEILLIANT
jgi:hypothetical protein